MEHAAKRFASWVLAIHLIVLAVVVVIVYIASREVYGSARAQALGQAKQHQELLAAQTARGIKSFYNSVVAGLELEARAGEKGATIAPLLWDQLRGRVTRVFSLDRAAMSVGHDETDDASVTAQSIARQAKVWLDSVDKPAVSPLMRIGDTSVNLVCVPVPGAPRQVLIAVVPMRTIEIQFLNELNQPQDMGTVLLDEQMRIMSAEEQSLVGVDVKSDQIDPRVRDTALSFAQQGKPGTREFPTAVTLSDITLKPAMLTIQPIDVPGKKWWLVISSGLSEVDLVVSQVFKRTIIGAILVIVAMTAILLSTSIQLIRNRIRLERFRHELLTKELSQAREIQLAWLPERQGTIVATDIAAVNQPASHVSGDFYNWFDLPDGRIVVAVGDVTGHGMAAAFLMATTQLLVRSTLPRVGDPGRCLEEVNLQLCHHVYSGQFVTLLIMVLDLEQNVVEVAVAGHPAPLIGEGGEFRPLPVRPHLVLGVDDAVTFDTQRFDLPPGASLLLYTDGVTDVQSPSGERFNDGLQRSLYGRFSSAQAILDTAIDAVNTFRGEKDLGDDLTLVAIQLQTAPAPPAQAAAAAV